MKKFLTLSSILFLFIINLQAQYTANFTYLKDIACEGDTTELISNSVIPPWDNIKSYEWNINGTGYQYGDFYLKTFLAPGTHTIGLRIKTDLDTVKSIYKQVKVSEVTADFMAEHLCVGELANFFSTTYTLNCKVDEYLWGFDNLIFKKGQNTSYVFESTGNHTVTLEVMTDNGCYSTITKTIVVNQIPPITLLFDPADTVIWKGQELTVTLVEPYANILWSTGATTNKIVITETDYYSVDVDDGGCQNSKGFQVNVRENSNVLKPMTLITPNSDGINDKWIIKPAILPGEKYEVLIYNRYGDEVYSSKDYDNDWTGTYEGDQLPEGTYYFIVIDQNGENFKGPINIIY